MHPFALYALSAGIVVSAVGALILALPLVRFGFRAGRDESSDGPPAGSDLSRFGRVAALVCFALTAGLTLVAVTIHARATVSVATPDLTPHMREVRSELERAGERQAEAVASLAALEGRLGEVERALDTLRTDAAATARRATASDAGADSTDTRPAGRDRAASRSAEVEQLRARLGKLERAASRRAEVEQLRARLAELERAASRRAEVEQLRARLVELERAPAASAEVERVRTRLAEVERRVRAQATAPPAAVSASGPTSAEGEARSAKLSSQAAADPAPVSPQGAAAPARPSGEAERAAEMPAARAPAPAQTAPDAASPAAAPAPPDAEGREALERFVKRMRDAVVRFGDRLQELSNK